jgi:GTP-binding protein
MMPVIALVGRPNVGKSTLFNRLTRSRDALVADFPGLTRDRRYGVAEGPNGRYRIIDTGGIGEDAAPDLSEAMAEQTAVALAEADLVVLLVDGRAGLTAGDELITEQLRERAGRVILVVNKTDRRDPDQAASEFHGTGFIGPIPLSAQQGRGIQSLWGTIEAQLAPEADAPAPGEAAPPEAPSDTETGDTPIRVAVVGRPNVGKSTLINRLIGEERVIAFDAPGTTRDSLILPFRHAERDFELVDTAGIRRRGKVRETVEKFSVAKALAAIDAAHVSILLFDARGGITDQDLHLLGYVLDQGRGVVLAINKWDGLAPERRWQIKQQLDFRLGFIDYAERHFISARHGTGVGHLLDAAVEAFDAGRRVLSANELTRHLEAAIAHHPPPRVQGRRIKLRYAHQGGRNPPRVVIHGNQTDRLPGSYQRYLEGYFREHLDLAGTPIRLEFRTGSNPFEGRRNPLTPRQARKRRRLMRHVKR